MRIAAQALRPHERSDRQVEQQRAHAESQPSHPVQRPGLQLPLRLLTSAPVVDSRDGTITSWFAFAAPPAAGSIASGLTGKVYVEPEERPAGSPLPEKDEQIVAVPTRAVRWQRNQPEVQRVAKSKAEPPQSIPVRVIMNLGTELLIAAALRPGEEVLLQPGRELPAGEQQ